MTLRVRIASACALLSGCSAVVAPTPGEPSLASSSPVPVARVSSLKPRVEPQSAEGPPAATAGALTRASLPAPAASEPSEPPVEELVATAREAFVHSRPSRRSPKLGYLRLGARVKRVPKATAGDDCPGGWYEIAPEGYVCAGPTASLTASSTGAPPNDVTDAAELARARPERDDPLPYLYARSKGFAPPLYARLPSAEEQTRAENVPLGRAPRSAPGWEEAVSTPLPELLAEGRALPTVHGFARAEASGPERAVVNSGFALLSTHEHEGRRFGLTTDLRLVPLDRVNRVRPSEFRGISLGGGVSLPVVFVRARHALLYAGSPERGLAVKRQLGHREALPLSGRSAFVGGRRYLETGAGDWLADAELVRIEPPKRLPPWAKGTRTWVSVSLSKQTLVAYVGAEPVYTTLVSTGAGVPADVDGGAESRATPLGEFLVHTKHVTATMSGDEVGDEFDLGDVPYVQYFSGGIAFHAVYWHDAFGTPRSHGCVNLSPIDARFLFHFTEPAVPRGWHGAFSLREGTLVSISQ